MLKERERTTEKALDFRLGEEQPYGYNGGCSPVIECPVCGFENVHPERVEATVTHTGSEGRFASRTYFWCEGGCLFSLLMFNHKGTSMIEAYNEGIKELTPELLASWGFEQGETETNQQMKFSKPIFSDKSAQLVLLVDRWPKKDFALPLSALVVGPEGSKMKIGVGEVRTVVEIFNLERKVTSYEYQYV